MTRRSTIWRALGLAWGIAASWLPVAAQSPVDAKAKDKAPDDAGVQIEFDEEDSAPPPGGGAWPYAPPVESVFANPAIASGLASGADAINRSIESLMDALFYSLLDNERNWPGSETTWYATNLKRDLYSTQTGSYVVVDRLELGPRYAKELWQIHGIPITLGLDGTVEVLQIYMRSDGQRLAEQRELSTLRRWVNNWFGLLPLAGAVLPPSFNENELYDPVTQVKTPLSFPQDASDFEDMPVGSIRSYAISGGIRFVEDLAGMVDGATRRLLERVGNVGLSVPYTIFRRGEHRINVLRRDEASAWVGVTDLRRTGHSLSPLLGEKYFVLRGALAARIFDWRWIWAGVPFVVLPVDVNFEQAAAALFDQVYEFDMRVPAARDAYMAAVRGDFLPARLRWLDSRERGQPTGVVFHFNRNQDRQEYKARGGPNIAVFRKERRREHVEAEVEITDSDGRFFVLEANHDVLDRQWDILVGEEETRTQHNVEMRVRRVVEKPDQAPAETGGTRDPGTRDTDQDEPAGTRHRYYFDAEGDPFRLSVGCNILDRYLNTVEYYAYLEELRFLTGLSLLNVPDLDLRDERALATWRKSAFFSPPYRAAGNIHVTPTYLGRFGAQAALSFSSAQLKRIIGRSEDEMWAAFARVFGHDERIWRDPRERATLGFQWQWWRSFLLYPARLMSLRHAGTDAIKEASNSIRQLLALKGITEPMPMLEAFERLIDSDYPMHLARVLLELADREQVPRRVVFSAQPKGSAPQSVKEAYGRLNNRNFVEGPDFPAPGRYATAKAKLANFHLNQPRESENKVHVAGVYVSTRAIPASIRALGEDPDDAEPPTNLDRKSRHVFVSTVVDHVPSPAPVMKLYVRVEQAGRIKIGKLQLAEQVLELPPVILPGSPAGRFGYEFWLTGPLSPLRTFLFEKSLGTGEELRVVLAASLDGSTWSDDRALEFRFEGGRLMPVSK